MTSAARLALLAAFALAGPALAQPSYDAFAFDNARTPAEKVVLCDTSMFLSQHPDLHAQRIVAPRSNGQGALLLPPAYVIGGQLFSDRYERLALKLVAARETTAGEVAAAQASVGKAMVDLYRPNRYIDHPFTVKQERACRAYAKEHGVHGGF